jgi:uncharacterized protein (DUF1501 family)
MDQAFAALLLDWNRAGCCNRPLVVFMTEFGRTPKINGHGGRDHWGAAGSIFFAGDPIDRRRNVGRRVGQAACRSVAPIT